MDIVAERPVDRPLLQRMTDRLAHRGPDGDGFHTADGMGMGHRRLAIIDLHTGDQPMYGQHGQTVVMFNGQIYNFRELRKDLEADGYLFRTQSDTEVILHGWAKWGRDCVTHFRGMFAIAIWDNRQKSLFLARDRVGKKPLYYSFLPDGQLLFASELKALLCHPALSRKLNLQAIDDFFAYGYVQDPDSIYAHVSKLPAATVLYQTRGHPPAAPKSYWDLPHVDGYRAGSEADLAAELISELREAVDIRRVSDVPIGAFLSGGVDSSAVVAMMAGLSGDAVKTFSIGFQQKNYDETAYAEEVSARYRTDHFARKVDSHDFGMVDRLATIFDEPFADSSALPTLSVSAIARERVTVALSGDGGDEIFAGYRRHLWHQREEKVRQLLPATISRPLFGQLGRIYPKMDWAPRMLRAKNTLQELALDAADAYFLSLARMPDTLRHACYHPDFKAALGGYRPRDRIRALMDRSGSDDPLTQAQYVDFKTWLPSDILTKVDRTSMAVSLEARAPLLDHKFLEWGWRLAPALRRKGTEGKYLFKKALKPYLSTDVLYRPKMGFSVPIADWFRGPLARPVREALMGEEMSSSGYFDSAALSKLLDGHQSGRYDHSVPIWSLLMFQRFLEKVHDTSTDSAAVSAAGAANGNIAPRVAAS